MNRYRSRQRWRKVQAGYYESPDGRYWARLNEGRWWLVRESEDKWYKSKTFGPYATLADCQEIAERKLQPLVENETCGCCGADIGPSSSFPWHLEDDDCRAIREPVV